MGSRDDLLAAALSLPTEERARIAHELLVSLDEGSDENAAEAWLTEIMRRLKEVDDGTAVLEDWALVLERLAKRWAAR
jgi:hypothetical protein